MSLRRDGRLGAAWIAILIVLPFAAVFLVGAVIAGALLGQQDTYTAQSVAQVEVSTSTAESSYEEAGSSQSMAENRTDEANAAMSGAQSPGSQTADSPTSHEALPFLCSHPSTCISNGNDQILNPFSMPALPIGGNTPADGLHHRRC